jgi:hypothetical protein
MKNLHDYAVFEHNRSTIGRWLGFLAILIAGGVSSLLSFAENQTGMGIFSATITTGVIYGGLHYIFNRWIWRLPIFGIPNLSGIWAVTGKTLDENGATRYDWQAEIDIEQKWEKIVIHQETKKSESFSYTATLAKLGGTKERWQLSYSYSNTPNENQVHELNRHKGFCELIFQDKISSASGSYFNSNGRRSYGMMELNKVGVE